MRKAFAKFKKLLLRQPAGVVHGPRASQQKAATMMRAVTTAGTPQPDNSTTSTSAAAATSTSSALLTAERSKKILAFGDSLTEGFLNFGMNFHPYADKLQELLKARDPMWEVTQRGESGECVLETMQGRLALELEQAEAQCIRYSWVLLLAGVNDIGSFSSPDDVFVGLRNMYEACGRHGAHIVAMTCMENRASHTRLDEQRQRQKLNDLIRQHCGQQQDGSTILVDLDKLIPYVKLSLTERAEIFEDGLHLTEKGYDKMAALIFKALDSAKAV